jgi:uncharacterized protein YndB with AHSA1/START domain
MSVKQEENGRHSVTDEFDVHGTPEEVWEAIATGPGMSAWFVPAEFEQRDGKPVTMKLKFGPTIEPAATITAWDPPRMYAGQNEGWGGSPPIATEWHVEARGGGMCRVRIVHSLFASTDDWDDQLEAAKSGWSGFLAILRVYLEHFRGMPSALMQIVVPVSTPDAETWDALTSALGLEGTAVGQRWIVPADAPPLGGIVEYLTEDPYDALLRLDSPGPGIVALGAATYPGGQAVVAMNLYLYGAEADAAVAREHPRWNAWFAERFPTPLDAQ